MSENEERKREMSLHPGTRQAIEHAIRAEMGTVLKAIESLEQAAKESGAFEIAKFKAAFEKCQRELSGLKNRIADLESGVSIYQEIADRRKTEIEELKDTIVKLTYEVSSLLSVLQNEDES